MTAAATPTFVEGVVRQYDYWLTVYRRTWKGTVISSFVSPLFYVLAMGVILGGFIEVAPSRLEGATSYLAFLAPGLVAAQAMMTGVGETTYPVMSYLKWQKVFHAMVSTPLTVAQIVVAHLVFVLFRVATTCAVFMLVLAPFGLFETWWGALTAFVVQVLIGMAFAAVVYGVSVRVKSESVFGQLYRLGFFPMFLFSGSFFPIANLGSVGEWVARFTPLWHGVNLSRMLFLDTVDWSTALINASVLAAMIVCGTWWTVRGLTVRLVS